MKAVSVAALEECGVAWIVEGGSEMSSEADLVIELAQEQQPRVGGERSLGHLDLDRQRRKEIEVE